MSAGADTVDVGASGLLESGTVWTSAKGSPVDDDDAPDYGRAPVAFGFGFAGRPYRQNEEGFAVGFSVEAPGYDGVLVGGYDPRAAGAYGNLGEGETAVFATGDKFDARAIFGDRVVSIMVGDDMLLQIDAKKKRFIANTPGGSLQLGSGGATLVDETGSASITCKGGTVTILGNIALGTNAPGSTLVSNNLLFAELTKIAASLASNTPTPSVPYVPTPLPVGAGTPGVYVK